jgi:plastocyanin
MLLVSQGGALSPMSSAGRYRPSRSLVAATLMLGAPAVCSAAALEITVVDTEGRPVPCAAVYAVPQAARAAAAVARDARSAPQTAAAATSVAAARSDPRCGQAAHDAEHAVMDQLESAFVPHMLVVERGTPVTFPNGDSVSHHVYSFSQAKKFELALYKGDEHPPLVFERAGIVVLGCNIHDGMLGYVVVVDTPHFTTTDAAGRAVLQGLTAGVYTVDAFTPRAKPKDAPPSSTLAVADDTDVARLELKFDGRLAAPHGGGRDNLTWYRY